MRTSYRRQSGENDMFVNSTKKEHTGKEFLEKIREIPPNVAKKNKKSYKVWN